MSSLRPPTRVRCEAARALSVWRQSWPLELAPTAIGRLLDAEIGKVSKEFGFLFIIMREREIVKSTGI